MILPPFAPSFPPSEYAVQSRAKVRDWIMSPLSDHNRAYRKAALLRAFGFSEYYFDGWIAGKTSMGDALFDQLAEWIDAHPDLSANNPSDDVTMWHDFDVDGG